MAWPYLPYTLPLLLAALLAAATAVAIWPRRSAPGAGALLGVMAAVVIWSGAYALELLGISLQEKLFWRNTSFVGRLALSPFLLVFMLIFTGRRAWLTQRTLVFLMLSTMLALALVWSNEVHRFVYANVVIDNSGPLPLLSGDLGPLVILLRLYAYSLIAAGTVMLLAMLRRCPREQRAQVASITLAILTPGMISILEAGGLRLFSPTDLTPLVATFSSTALCWFYFNFRLVDILPLARDAVMEGMRDGIVVTDAAQRIVDCNVEAARMMGCTKAEALGRPVAKVLAARPGWAERFGTVAESPSELAAGEGADRRLYDLRVSPVYDWQQRQVGRVTVLRDVTERRRADEALRANEQRYRELFAAERRQAQEMELLERARTALAQEMDLQRIIRTVVEAAARMFGYTHVSAYLREGDELTLQHYVGYTTVFWRIPFSQGINGRVARTGQPVLLPDVRAAPDYMEAYDGVVSEVCVPLFDRGEVAGTFNVESSGVALGDADLRLMLALSEHVNFAIARARLYTQVRESEERFRRLADASFEGIAIHDNGIVLDANQAFAQMFGYDLSEVIGVNLLSFASMESREAIAVRGLSAGTFEGVGLRKDGSRFPVEAQGRMMPYQGQTARVTAVRDVSTRKQAEEALRESEARYRQRATEMTALYETMRDITTQRDLTGLLHTIVERATQLLGHSGGGGGLYLCDPVQNEVRCVVSHNTLRDYAGVTLRYGEGAAGTVADTGKPLNIDDYSKWPGRAAVFESENPFKYVLNVPMIWQGRVIGVLTVNTPDRPFTDADVNLLTLFADQATVAVENTRLFDEVQQLAITDELTGIYNRRQLFELGAREMLRAHRFDHPLSALMVDIDQFKRVNDAYGHGVGDQVLRAVAQLCTRHIRDFDLLARYGGEEFTILLPETDVEGARHLAERLRESISLMTVVTPHATVQVTISVGVACSSPQVQEFAQLLEQADQALYIAKQAGRNRVELWSMLQ